MTLKEHVIANVKSTDYYTSRFPRWNKHNKENVPCIFHDDKKPSLSIDLKNGGAHCHASSCGISIGNIVHFEAVRQRIPEIIAAKKLYREFIRPVISAKITRKFRDNLFTNTDFIYRIKKELGLNLQTIRRFNLGLDPDSNRITIPVYDLFNQCVNIRFYRLPSMRNGADSAKIYNYRKGYGTIDLFPFSTFVDYEVNAPLYFMASECEALLAIQLGLNAFCTTTGEGSWSDDWNIYIKDRNVNLLFDLDKGGRLAEAKIHKQFATIAKSVLPIRLKFRTSRSDWKDFRDWIIRDRNTIANLPKQHVLSQPVEPELPLLFLSPSVEQPRSPEPLDKKIHDVSEISSNSSLLNKVITCHAIVSAKSSNTFSIPWKFHVLVKNRPVFEFKLEMGRELLRLIRCSDSALFAHVAKLVGNSNAEITPIDYVTATEVEIIPTAIIDRDIPYTVQSCIHIGSRIESNVPYEMQVIPTSEIRSQATVGIIIGLTPLSKSIDSFHFTPETYGNLSTFQAVEGCVWEKLVEVCDELSQRHTRIYNRFDWHAIALLTWCCPIGWKFPGESELQRGWINSLALGDTETGKSKVAKTLQSLFNCGVFVNAENCTYVGLVGGAIKVGSGQLMLRWGRIPLSDKQLVVLEELSGLGVEDIANMSDVRSSGIARLDKGGISAETNSRTRLLCLSNSRNSRKSLSNYLFGVHAIQELVGHGEDIARFDLITTLVDNEVSNALINANFATIAKLETAGSDQWRELCHFIWALNPNQIYFTQEAYEQCLEETKKLSVEYHPSIPIFKGGSGRYKLARIAAAIACVQFAWFNDRIEIRKQHVDAAARLLRHIYNKPSFGYALYSQGMLDREKIKDERILKKEFVDAFPRSILTKVADSLIHATQITRDELQAIGSVNVLTADRVIGAMFRERALRKGVANIWEITPAGKRFLEKIIDVYTTT